MRYYWYQKAFKGGDHPLIGADLESVRMEDNNLFKNVLRSVASRLDINGVTFSLSGYLSVSGSSTAGQGGLCSPVIFCGSISFKDPFFSFSWKAYIAI